MEWYTISINPPEINKGQDLIFRRESVFGGKVYSMAFSVEEQADYSDFDEAYGAHFCGSMTHWAVLTDYNEGNNNE